VSYADASVGKIMQALKTSGAQKNTVVVLWGDHGWHLGEHAVWGKHTLFEESLRSPLSISKPGMKLPGQATDAVVETLDVFPTLCELAGVPVPGFVQGRSLVPLFESPDKIGHAAIAYSGKRQTIRTKRYRLIDHMNGYVELYDHFNFGETENVAEANPGVVQKLKEQLRDQLGGA
jgi:iduronate 2-sulfatase